MKKISTVLLSVGVCLVGCEGQSSGQAGTEETGTEETGTQEAGNGEQEEGGDDFAQWCEICQDPPEDTDCGFVEGPPQRANFTIHNAASTIDMDEPCTVASVSPTLIELDCETHDPQIELELVEPWVPNIEVGATMHLVAVGQEDDWALNVNWRLDRADDTLALAGHQTGYGFEDLGVGAIPVTRVHDACGLDCVGDLIFRQIGVAFDDAGAQQILFAGDHATVGGLDIWVAESNELVCDAIGDYDWSFASVFVSAG